MMTGLLIFGVLSLLIFGIMLSQRPQPCHPSD
jgi:hypothetical protein